MNRWYFWVLAPVAIVSAIIIPLTAAPSSFGGQVAVWLMVATLLSGVIGLADVRRFGWALRIVAAIIVVAGVAYFVSELVAWRNGEPTGFGGRRSSRSLLNSVLFLLVFGLPAVRYLLFGRSESVVDVIAVPEAVDEEHRPPRE
jgi:uncharacterized iron-regulated membrane protein